MRGEGGELILQTGVWLASEGAHGNTLLEVTIEADDGFLDEFECVGEGKPYREWLIRAATINPLVISTRIAEE